MLSVNSATWMAKKLQSSSLALRLYGWGRTLKVREGQKHWICSHNIILQDVALGSPLPERRARMTTCPVDLLHLWTVVSLRTGFHWLCPYTPSGPHESAQSQQSSHVCCMDEDGPEMFSGSNRRHLSYSGGDSLTQLEWCTNSYSHDLLECLNSFYHLRGRNLHSRASWASTASVLHSIPR